MKKIKITTAIYILISLCGVLIAPVVISTSANAEGAVFSDASGGSRTTATQKEWFSMLLSCVNDKRAWQYINTIGFGGMPADKLNSGEWFSDANVIHGTTTHSPIIEKQIIGSYDDGQIACGASNNELVKKGLEILGLNKKEVICDASDDYKSNGVLRPRYSDNCGEAYDQDNNETQFDGPTEDALSHFAAVTAKKTFKSGLPANSLYNLSAIESYYVLYDAFITACASGGPYSESTGHTYHIKEQKGNSLVDVWYDKKEKPAPEDHIFVYYNESLQCQEIAENLSDSELIKLFGASVEKGEVEEPKKETQDDSQTDDQPETNCQNSGGAGSLGWIVCSILDWMSKATQDLYTNVVKPALRVEPELFKGGDSIGAEKAWNYFRDFANIIFIIVVLFVIFSQLTGVGIDNYGIKKILPKLVVVAVLVNLSYLICLVCVDISNIVGNGAQNLFNSIPVKEITPENPDTGSETIKVSTNEGTSDVEIDTYTNSSNDASNTGNTGALVTTGIVAVGAVSAAVGAVAIYANPALLLTLFVSVLGVLISVLFVFILLAGRKAAIVLLTVISPIAFILYMLPNTKKIFDKWLNLWKAMLIVYPVCGLLIGGGNFASRLMLTVGDKTSVATIFTAMIVGIVPIFFIPSLIKSAYAALGSIGGTLAGFGGRLSGGATNRMRGSQAYQNAQNRSQARQKRLSAQRRAGVYVDKEGKLQARRRPSARAKRWLSGTAVGRRLGLDASIGKNTNEFAQLELARGGDVAGTNVEVASARFQANRNAQALKAYQDQYADYNAERLKGELSSASSWINETGGDQRMSALIGAAEARGLEGSIFEMLKNNNNIHTKSATMSTLANSKNKVLKAYGKAGRSDFNSFMSGTGDNTMQGYIKGKGKEFVDGIDDKALKQIASYNNGSAMNTDLLAHAAANTENADSLKEINDMLEHRTDVSLSGNQLANYDASTIAAIQKSGGANLQALVSASDALAADPNRVGKLDPNARQMINIIRKYRSDGGNTNPI